jgi:hypothetical protein
MSGAVLNQRLRAAGAGDLADAIDWPATPKRGFGVFLLLGLATTAAIAIPLGLATFAAVWIAPMGSGVVRFAAQYVIFPVALLIAIALIAMCGRIWNRERAKYPELVLFGRRKPTLYLRRFRNENPNLADDQQIRVGAFGFAKLSTETGLEDTIQLAMRRVAPLVCLGDPAMQRATGGGGRFIAQDARWQDAVKALQARSNVVFIHYEAGGSVEWEVERFLSQEEHPCLIWMDSVPLVATAENPDRLGRFPRRLADLLRRSGATIERLGGEDYERGYLFGLHAGKIAWARSRPAGREFEVALKRLIKTLKIKSARAAPQHTRGFPLTAFVVNIVPFAGIWASVMAVFLGLAGFAGYALISNQRHAAEQQRLDALLQPAQELLVAADALRPVQASETYRSALEALPQGETHDRASYLRDEIRGGLCLAAAHGPDLTAGRMRGNRRRAS